MTTKYVYIPLESLTALQFAVTNWENENPDMRAAIRGVYIPSELLELTNVFYTVGHTEIEQTICGTIVDCTQIWRVIGFNLSIEQSQLPEEVWAQITAVGGQIFDTPEAYMNFELTLQSLS